MTRKPIRHPEHQRTRFRVNSGTVVLSAVRACDQEGAQRTVSGGHATPLEQHSCQAAARTGSKLNGAAERCDETAPLGFARRIRTRATRAPSRRADRGDEPAHARKRSRPADRSPVLCRRPRSRPLSTRAASVETPRAQAPPAARGAHRALRTLRGARARSGSRAACRHVFNHAPGWRARTALDGEAVQSGTRGATTVRGRARGPVTQPFSPPPTVEAPVVIGERAGQIGDGH